MSSHPAARLHPYWSYWAHLLIHHHYPTQHDLLRLMGPPHSATRALWDVRVYGLDGITPCTAEPWKRALCGIDDALRRTLSVREHRRAKPLSPTSARRSTARHRLKECSLLSPNSPVSDCEEYYPDCPPLVIPHRPGKDFLCPRRGAPLALRDTSWT